MKKIFSILTLLCLASFAHADNIITFDFAAATGLEPSTNSLTNDPLLFPAIISRGAGINAAGNAGRFNASGWTAATIADAISSNDFFEVNITNTGVNGYSITNLIISTQRSGTGPTNFFVRASHDGFTANLGTYDQTNVNLTVTTNFDLSGILALQNRVTPITFRFYGILGQAAGVWGFEGAGDDILFQGSTTNIGGGGTSTNVVTVVPTQNASELGTNGIFTVNSTGTNFPIIVTYTVGGSANITNDYAFLPPATTNSIVMSTSATNIEIVPVNDGDTNELNPEDVVLTLDANGPGWTAGNPNSAIVQIFQDVVSNTPPVGTNGVPDLTGFQLILKQPKIGKPIKWKSAKGISPLLKGPKGQIATTSNTVSSIAYALIVGASGTNGTNAAVTNTLNFITAGKITPVTKGRLFKKGVKAKFKATKTSKLGIGTPIGTTSVKLVIRVNGTSGTNSGSQYFTNTYTTVVK